MRSGYNWLRAFGAVAMFAGLSALPAAAADATGAPLMLNSSSYTTPAVNTTVTPPAATADAGSDRDLAEEIRSEEDRRDKVHAKLNQFERKDHDGRHSAVGVSVIIPN